MKTLQRTLCWLLVYATLFGALPRAHARPFGGDFEESSQEEEGEKREGKKEGLQFRLSEGAEQPERRAPAQARASAVPLSEAETQKVLKLLPPMKAAQTDEQEFAVREGSPPPPRAGQTIETPFPAPSASDAPAPPTQNAKAPRVLRVAPEGEVSLAPQLSVTFSEPMVALASHADLAAQQVPVELSPQPAGRWRWVGTKTLLFEPEQRFPMATRFAASVRAGARSAAGGAFEGARAWSFSTPPPTLVDSYPKDAKASRGPVIFLAFDQRVDPSAVQASVRVTSGGRAFRTRLATSSEVNSDEEAARRAKAAGEGRWLALRVLPGAGANEHEALPADAAVSVSVGPGTPSAEGPLVTTRAQEFHFNTFGAFRALSHGCGNRRRCMPSEPWEIVFSNPLDTNSFKSSLVRVEPSVEGLQVHAWGQSLMLDGMKQGRRAYRVTLDGSLRDSFGQTLGSDVTVTFNVGPEVPSLNGGRHLIVHDPAAPPSYSVYSVNVPALKVSLYRTSPADWARYAAHLRAVMRNERNTPPPPGSLVALRTIQLKAAPDETIETAIDLRPALNADGLGHVYVVVEPSGLARSTDYEVSTPRAWVQVTNLGLDAFVDQTELLAWATSLKTGEALSGVELSIVPTAARATSGPDGLARIPLPEAKREARLLVARRGDDSAILPEYDGVWYDQTAWHRRASADALRWFVFDDRKTYRPGEEVRVKGWLRRFGGGKAADLLPLGEAAASVAYTLKDARGNKTAAGVLRLNPLGGFDANLKLPAAMNLGTASLELQAQRPAGAPDLGAQRHTHTFQVQEFRRPEFQVAVESDAGPHFVRGHADANVTASYYAGGGLPDAAVSWQVTSTEASFTPPNRGAFSFGRWSPWWRHTYRGSASQSKNLEGRTDASGRHRLRVDFESVEPARPSSVTVQATVADVNRQAWADTKTLLVHPSELYVGLRAERAFVQRGEPLEVQTIVTDIEGRAAAGRDVRVRASLLEWVQEGGRWVERETKTKECSLKSEAEPSKCSFRPDEGGEYRVTAAVSDERGRPNESELRVWVAGGRALPRRDVANEAVELIPDRREYRAGESAAVLVRAPFFPAEGVLTLRRGGLVSTRRFRMDAPTHTLHIPLEEAFVPNVHVQVDLVGTAERAADFEAVEASEAGATPRRPAHASGTLNLNVPPVSRRLSVAAVPRESALEPGATTTVEVELRDAAGRPVSGGEAAVIVVDEAVLALADYRLPDPLAAFYPHLAADVRDHHLRDKVVLGRTRLDFKPSRDRQGFGVEFFRGRQGVLVGGGGAGGGGTANMNANTATRMASREPGRRRTRLARPARGNTGEEDAEALDALTEEEAEAVRLRENFGALAVFAPTLKTDARGRASVEVKLPDSLTRYRVMAVAVAGDKQFGSSESNITARLPLMVRPSPPRFLNFGDRADLPVVVQNQTSSPLTVDLAVRASNAALTEGAGRRVVVPANDRAEVRFPVEARAAGVARFQFGALAGRMSDAAELQLPVWTPATAEAFAAYGVIDAGTIVQPVQTPSDIFRQFGGLELTTSSTQLHELTDALLYLRAYPFECSEQLASRVMGVAALRDVLSAFRVKDLPPPAELIAAVARDLKRLEGLQNDDGGFAFWRRGDKSWPYLSVHVAHAFERARQKNFEVPSGVLQKSRAYLRSVERRIPADYSAESRRAVVAYALYVRGLAGDNDSARAQKLLAEAGLEKHSLETLGWLLPVLASDARASLQTEAVVRHLTNRAVETASAAHFTDSYTDGAYLLLHSDRRADAVLLDALIAARPQSDLVPKLVRGLLSHRKQGRWTNTQENVFALVALGRYFTTYERATPDFTARAWLGPAHVAAHEFRGRTADRQSVRVPMSYLAGRATPRHDFTLSKEGAGRLYYRLGMSYAPANLKLDAADQGFTVERAYEAVDDPSDVRREADGTWRIRSGARVRVRLTLAAHARRYHVALADPLPAGLEALNPTLAVTGQLPDDPKEDAGRQRRLWWQRAWFEHQNLRDERAEAFASLLWEGVHHYSYVARATTPGLYVVPPPKAEEMYHPETFGRGQTDRVRVE